ncbi:hypothetical protein [Salinarimonas soli]|uniref:Uncharacterized protein n=1 Tax=Salinarimonas soli TaxID=1638099 RepID=A0A5B2VAY6_9HYPH|nr:hypothetical protein [Salinarimonas soli]KAA2235600.1 hypothetical protein F0L46_19055 [Salinarimonas soli]
MSSHLHRLSLLALLLALGSLVLGIAAAVEALAHHPGSHAVRKGGAVALEAVATVSDGCTTIGSVALGAPAGIAAPAAAEPVTVRLARPEGAVCTQALGTARREIDLMVPAGRAILHLFVVGPDGAVVSTERVPIKP